MGQQFRSPAAKAANEYFKPAPEKVATDYEQARQAFPANMERLRAERLAREARQKNSPTGCGKLHDLTSTSETADAGVIDPIRASIARRSRLRAPLKQDAPAPYARTRFDASEGR